MASFLIGYKSREGQTAKVADRVASALEQRGHEVRTISVTEWSSADSIADYDAVLLGDSIHLGRHAKQMIRFVRDHRDELAVRPNGFFQVSLSAADPDDEDGQTETVTYIHEFVEKTGWEPDQIGVFGGALRYSKYGFITRYVMKRIARNNLGITDTSRDHEFTDWDEVETFALDFAVLVESQVGGEGETGESAA
ncbi:flavodoxin domain-containing protein [Haloferax namakaokahaiae]|uniref:Flavodoxin domain-containing protein n=1 Tax=Haloferax namakaokahaiae TaxID=1748331 RepID=A0ABD5ZAE7_9EURY